MKTLLNTLTLIILSVVSFLAEAEAQTVTNTIDTLNTTMVVEDGIVTFTWTTPREVNTSYFLVEKSSNGIDYTLVGRRNANSSTMKCSTYEYTDLFDSTATYYRIKLVTMDLNISDIAVVNPVPAGATANKAIALK